MVGRFHIQRISFPVVRSGATHVAWGIFRLPFMVEQIPVAADTSLIPGIGIGSLESFLETVINMTAATYLIPILFLLIAYIVLRLKKNNIERDFKMGNRGFGIFMGILLFLILIFVIFMSIFPEPALIFDAINGIIPEGEGNPIIICAYKVLGLIVFIWFALICWGRHSKNKLNIDQN